MPMTHEGRASMMYTAIRPEGILNFLWPKPEDRYLDIAIWKWAALSKKAFLFRPSPLSAIGIKHCEGLRVNRSHMIPMQGPSRNWRPDPNSAWLRANIDPESFDFYDKQRKAHEARTV